MASAMRSPHRVILLACLAAAPLAAQSAESLDFLAGLPDFREIRNMLPAYLNRAAMTHLADRERKVAQLSTAQDVAARRAYIRERMLRALGGLPERTPLNARVTGVLDRDGYRVERIVFESQPRFYVTANLYLPKAGRPPYPAVLFPLGHEAGAKSHNTWQQILITLARRGYVALAWDPIGQGERAQLYDADLGESKVVRSTTEHSMVGIQCLLTGDNLARYTIWDGMRALDYLLSRSEVDPARVACTGNSGGGTHTAYLSALDDRIQVAAPSCYITSWRRLLESIGPQDAEQNIPPGLADGLDQADFVLAFAPKPYLILSAIRDFFSISGARETFEEARRVYTRLDAEQKIKMVEADDGHGYTKPRRQAAYAFLGRWLKGVEDNEPEQPVAAETEEALRATESGQVATSLGGETVFSLNRKRVEQFRSARDRAARRAREITGFQRPEGPLRVRPYGRIARAGYRIEKLIYETEPEILVPALLWVPDGEGRRPAILYVHGRGKSAGSAEIEQLVKAGTVVLSIDSRGTGETAYSNPNLGSDFPRWFGDYGNAMRALLIGRTFVGMRAADIVRAVDLLAADPRVDAGRIYGLGRDAGAVPLLHAAVFDPRIQKLALEGLLLSYESVASHRVHRGVFENVVPGVLRHYDLPDLVAALAPRPVAIANVVDPLGQRVPLAEAARLYRGARVAERKPDEPVTAVFKELLP